MAEGNNVQVLSRLFKNVFIRYDKDFETTLVDYKFSDHKNEGCLLRSEPKTRVVSEILIFTANGEREMSFELPYDDMKEII